MPLKDKDQRKAYQRMYRKTHRLIRREQKRRHLLRLKLEVLTYYGNGKLACGRCGYDDIRALTIDHINGDGTKQKEREGIIGGEFYAWLKRHQFPSGFQTLCMNCQYLKRVENKEYGEHELINEREKAKVKIAEFVNS